MLCNFNVQLKQLLLTLLHTERGLPLITHLLVVLETLCLTELKLYMFAVSQTLSQYQLLKYTLNLGFQKNSEATEG